MDKHQTPKPRRFRPLRTKQQERQTVSDDRFEEAGEGIRRSEPEKLRPEDLVLPEIAEFEAPTAYIDDSSCYLAIMNLDFNQFDATDALALASSFLPVGEQALSSWVFFSDYGMTEMENERKNGPYIDVKGALIKATKGDLELRELVASYGGIENYDSILKSNPQLEERIARSAVVAYEQEKLLYCFAVVRFSSKQASDIVYSNLNNVELEATGCLLDCRIVQDSDMEELLRHNERIKSFAGEVPQGYSFREMEAANFVRSKPQLSWEQDVRKEKILKRKFTTKEIDEMDARGAWDEFVDTGDEVEAIEEDWRNEEEDIEIENARALLGLSKHTKSSIAGSSPQQISSDGDEFKKVDEKEFQAKLAAALERKPTDELTPFQKFLRDNKKLSRGGEMSGTELEFRRQEPDVLIERVDTRFIKEYRRLRRKLEECDNNKQRIILERMLTRLVKDHPDVLIACTNENTEEQLDDRFAEPKDDEM